MNRLTDGESRELARRLVAREITAAEYLKAVLGDPPPEFERLPVGADASPHRAMTGPDERAAPPRRRLTDAEIDALARRAKALL